MLGKTAGGDLKHAVGPDKWDRRVIDALACKNSGINAFLCTLIKRHRGFDILNVILAEREHLVAHSHCCSATAEVRNLIPLVYRTAGFYENRTITRDKAPCIQSAAIPDHDLASAFEPDLTVIAGHIARRGTGAGSILPADTESAQNSERYTVRQGQPFILIAFV